MVSAVDTKTSEGRIISVVGGVAAEGRVSLARTFAVFNFPSEALQASAGRIIAPVKRDSDMEVSEARVFAIVRGRTADPKCRVWTFTLDGHDFLVIRLGDTATLIYDTASEQWIDWDSAENGAWRPNTGMTWQGATALADTYGSPVIAGDDTFGLLWFLDPKLAWDENPDDARATQQIAFERIVTGQVLAVGRASIPCYGIFLAGDNYGSDATEYVASVRLDYSDDQGRNFESAESLLSDIATTNPYSWYSLGQIEAPGRIFRVVDTGVLTRIDSMSMNDDG